MSFNIKVGGVWQTVQSVWVKVGGAWQEVAMAYVKVAGAWQQVLDAMTASSDKASVSANDSGFAACGDAGTTDVVTVTPLGGTAPYTYAWTLVSAQATSGPYVPSAGTSPATAFTAPGNVCANDAITEETWRCTVTDDNSDIATVDVTVQITWTDLS